MPITPNKIPNSSIVSSLSEALSVVNTTPHTISPGDILTFTSPTEKLFRYEDLKEWFGRGLYIFSLIYNNQLILLEEPTLYDDDAIGRLVAIKIGSGNNHQLKCNLEKLYPYNSKHHKEQFDLFFKQHPIDECPAFPSDKLENKWREESGECYKICAYDGKCISFGVDDYYEQEKYHDHHTIKLNNFTTTAKVTDLETDKIHHIPLIVSPSTQVSTLPEHLLGQSKAIINLTINSIKPPTVKDGEVNMDEVIYPSKSITINNLILPTCSQSVIIIGRDLLPIFEAITSQDLSSLKLQYEYTSLLTGYLLSTSPKTPQSILTFSHLDPNFYKLISLVHNIDINDPLSIFNAFLADYPDQNPPVFTEAVLNYLSTLSSTQRKGENQL